MIFGPNGETIEKTDDSYFTKDGYVHKSGSMYFGPNGQSANDIGGMLFTRQGTITPIGGNMFMTPKGTYNLSGSLLYDPDGRSWSGVKSVEDAKVIIMQDLARRAEKDNHQQQKSFSAPIISWDKSEGKPMDLSDGAMLALIALLGIGALLLIIFL